MDLRAISGAGLYVARLARQAATGLVGARPRAVRAMAKPAAARAERRAPEADALGIGTWVWDARAGSFQCLIDGSHLLGLPPGGFSGRFADYLSRVHPQDAGRVRRAFYDCLKGVHRSYRTQERVVWPDGSVHWLETSARGEYAPDGRCMRISGMTQDISSRRLHALIELSADLYWETDAEHRYTAIEFGRRYRGAGISGASLGKTPWEVPSGNLNDADWEAHRKNVRARLPFTDLVCSRLDKSGVERYFEISGEPRYDPQGRFLGYRGIGRDVTERQQAERAWRESEGRFRALVALSADWYWEQDAELRFSFLSKEYVDRTGGRIHELIGLRRWEIDGMVPEEGGWEQHRAEVEAHRPYRDLRLRRVMPDGRTMWFSVSGEPVNDAAGRFAGYRGTGRDITAETRAARLLRLEHRVTRSLAEAGTTDAALLQVIREVCEAADLETGTCWRVDPAAGVLRFAQAWSVPDEALERFLDESRGQTYAPGEGLAGQVWQLPEPTWSSDLAADPRVRFAGPSARAGIAGAILFPLIAGGEVTGVMAFSTRAPRKPDPRLLQTLHVIGSQLGQYLRRKDGEAALAASEERLRSITDLTSDYYWEQDEELRFTKRIGISWEARDGAVDGLVGKRRWEIKVLNMTEADWAAHRADLEARREFRNLEIERPLPGGGSRWISTSGRPVYDAEGRFRGYRGVGQDITARKRAEQELRASEERFRSLTALSADWYWEQDHEYRLTYSSRDLHEFLGAPAGAPGGATSAGYLGARRWDHPALNMTEADWQRHRETLERREAYRDFELQRVRDDGRLVWYSLSGEPVFDAGGRFTGYRGIGREITRERRAQQLLDLEHRVVRSLAESESEQAGLRRVLQDVCEVEGLACGRYLRLVGDELCFECAWVAPGSGFEKFVDMARELRYRSGEGIAGRAWSEGAAVWTSDVQADRRVKYQVLAEDSGARGVLAFPVLSDGRVIGVMTFSSPSVREPDARLLTAVRVVGSQVGVFLRRKQAERRRRESEAQLRLEYAVAGALAGAATVAEGLREALRAVCQAEDWECARFFRADDDAGMLYFEDGWCIDDPAPLRFVQGSRGMQVPYAEGLIGEAARTRLPVWSADASRDPRRLRSPALDDYGMHATLVLPVLAEGRCAGVIAFSSREMRPAGTRLQAALRAICEQVGQFVQRKHAERRLAESEERYRALVDLSSDWYWRTDKRHRFIFRAGEVLERMGIPPEADYGLARWEMNTPNMTPADWAEHRRMLERREEYRDVLLARKSADGRVYWATISGRPLYDAAGEFIGYHGTGRDVTSQVLAEQRLKALAAGLEKRVAQRTAELLQANSDLDSFSFSVSHDLRQPLNAIAGFAELLREQGDGNLRAISLDEIDANVTRMDQMIEALLALARAGRGELRRVEVDMGAMADEVLREQLAASPLGAEIALGELPAARGDPALLRQVWANLIGNAIKYAPRGQRPHLEIEGRRLNDGVEYAVRDHGVGFDMRHAAHLFEAFRRLPSAEGYAGNGVGLALVQRIVSRHGGTIRAEAAPGAGATFRFTLPD